MAMNRAQFKRQLQEGLNTNFGLEYKRHPEEWRNHVTVNSSKKAYEEDNLLMGFGSAPVKAEGAGVAYDSGSELWAARYQHETIALAFSITEEAEEDGLYGSLGAKYSKALARSMQNTKELKGAGLLNNGFSSSYLGGDGVALFSASHPLGGGGTFSNILATPADLHEASLEALLVQMAGFVDDRGLPVRTMAKKLIIPRQSQYIAKRLLSSPMRPGTADNDINAIHSGGDIPGGYAVNHYLTDTNAFFLTTDCPDGLKHFVRVKIKRMVEGDFETGNMRYRARERYVFGWTDPRGAMASAGS